MDSNPTIIIDNGASSIKIGCCGYEEDPRIVPNAVVKPRGTGAKLYIGHEIEKCRDLFGLYYRRPFEKGILTDWDTEKAIWDKMFSSDGLDLTTRGGSLVVTEPYFNLPAVYSYVFCGSQILLPTPQQRRLTARHCRLAASLLPYGDLFDTNNAAQTPEPPHTTLSPTMTASGSQLQESFVHVHPECCIIVDSGFSSTHIIPIMSGNIIWDSVRRIDIGGKLLSNHLKEVVSFRHWDMMEHTYVMNNIKEACCYVSNNFDADLEACKLNPRKNHIVQEYVFPDYTSTPQRPGHIRAGPNANPPPRDPSPIIEDQDGVAPKPPSSTENLPVLYMANERFTIPEILFNPLDIGLNQAGLPEAIAASIGSLAENVQDLAPLFWANIGLIGGNFKLPGIEARLTRELRALAPPEFPIRLFKASNPVISAYHAARKFATENPRVLASFSITRAEFDECGGSNACRRKFGNVTHRFGKSKTESNTDEDDELDVGGSVAAVGESVKPKRRRGAKAVTAQVSAHKLRVEKEDRDARAKRRSGAEARAVSEFESDNE